MRFHNASFYQFAHVADPDGIAAELSAKLRKLDVKGTLLLAPEGVNGFLAAVPEVLETAVALVRGQFPSIDLKISPSEDIPFGRLNVRVKPEIVTFRVPEVSPPAPAPRLSGEELARWYDEGREFLLLDTRNEYEVRLGKFKNARSLDLKTFVELPSSIRPTLEDYQKLPVVTYCTGGIRCEKAAPYLRTLGIDAYQLDGGILRYFETVGGKHWEGECFVFDQRVAVSDSLQPSGARLCENCQGPIPAQETRCIHCGTGNP